MDGLSLEESLCGIDPSLFRLFREKTSDIQYSKLEKDQYIARWLKARSWDVDKAEKMFRAHLQWRNELKLDELLSTFRTPEVIEKYFPGGICGQDKFGRPTFICPAGTADVIGLMRSASRTQLALSRYYLMEAIVEEVLPAQSRKLGRPIDQLVIIFDLQHMNRRQLWRPWLNFVLELTSIFEVNFPELMAVCFVLNAPSFFSMIFSLLKPLLSKETQDKIHILGSNYLDELLKLFNPEDLPAHYGGTMRDPDGDPRCPSRICWGGVVPESYYQIQQSSPTDVADDAFLLVPIGRGSKEYCYIGEAKASDTVTWEFYTESNDIAFSLWVESSTDTVSSAADESSRRRSTKTRGHSGGSNGGSMTASFSFNNLLGGQGAGGKLDLKQVTQPVRVDCDLVPEMGSRKVEIDGNYYLLFDNSYSWTRAKRVWCKAEVAHSQPSMENRNSNNGFVEDREMNEKEVEKAVDDELSEVMEVVCSPTYSSLSTLDLDVSALMMILLRTLPIIRSRFRSSRSHSSSSSSPQQVRFKRLLKTAV